MYPFNQKNNEYSLHAIKTCILTQLSDGNAGITTETFKTRLCIRTLKNTCELLFFNKSKNSTITNNCERYFLHTLKTMVIITRVIIVDSLLKFSMLFLATSDPDVPSNFILKD